ncbi:MAG: hypothetical protein K2N94_15895, partial [Lachnospiraceae bacterium]|nr:hypothetical protein [Lachnospiraceae bacterium]
IFGILAGSFFAFVIFCLIYTRKRDYSVEIPVILYSDSAQNYILNGTESRLHIEGTARNRLFRSAVFSGELWLDGMEEMKNCVLDEMSIYDGKMRYLFLMGKEDIEGLTNMYTSELQWDDEKGQVLLYVYDKERPNYTLDGFVAAGPFESPERSEELWEAGGLLSSLLQDGEPVYGEWELQDVFYDVQEQEFVFLEQRLEEVCLAALAGDDEEARGQKEYPVYAHFAGTKLALDRVSILDYGEKEYKLEISFRFASLEEYRQGISELRAALSRLPAEVSGTEYFDGNARYVVEKEEGTSYLEIVPYQTHYQFNVRICTEAC